MKSPDIVDGEKFSLPILHSFCVTGEYAESIKVPQENAQKVSKRIRRIHGKYLSLYGEQGKLGLFEVHKIVSDYAESIETYSENAGKESLRIWRRRKETLGVLS